jgi:hypothetical protein
MYNGTNSLYAYPEPMESMNADQTKNLPIKPANGGMPIIENKVMLITTF